MDISFSLVDKIDPVAIYAAIVATTVLLIEVVKWLRSGPRLSVNAVSNIQLIPSDPTDPDAVYVTIDVTNRGDAVTTLKTLGGHYYSSFWMQIRNKTSRAFIVTTGAPFQDLPHVLAPGSSWGGAMRQDSKVMELARTGRLYAVVFHSMSRKPAKVRIRFQAGDEPSSKAPGLDRPGRSGGGR